MNQKDFIVITINQNVTGFLELQGDGPLNIADTPAFG